MIEKWEKKPRFKSFCKQVHKFLPKYLESNPMVKQRFKYMSEYLKTEYADVLDPKVAKIAIVSHAGFIKRYFNDKATKNAVPNLFDKSL